ncbi:hypothetical protein HZC00_05060 [Candidatus Kaiserbacteria bacterium]|nr:hypothetical protein [Candidatus Kaiserbacteria bacterium]
MSFKFFLGGADAEMRHIAEVLSTNDVPFVDAGLGWGAHASAYAAEIAVAAQDGFTPVLVELDNELHAATEWSPAKNPVALPPGTVVVDHHGNRSGEPASILQVLALIGREPTRWDDLIAANDSGFIPAMLAIGATDWEVDSVRAADRSAQGITPEQESEAERAIASTEVDGRLKVVHLAHSKCATITDRLFGRYDQLLVLSGDGEANFYGDGALCAVLKEKFAGWTGGSGLGQEGGNAFWGGNPPHAEVEKFLRERFAA